MKDIWKWFAKHALGKPLTRAEKQAAFVKAIIREFAEKRRQGLCPFCSNLIDTTEFSDELSRKEFEISGLCQKCQDGMFGKDK